MQHRNIENVARAGLADAIEAADLRVLVVCLFQATADRRWLQPPFIPRRDVDLVPDPDAGFDRAEAAAIRGAAYEVFGHPAKIAIPNPSGKLLVEMMSHCLGERVPPEYGQMVAEDLEFADRDSNGTYPLSLDVIIIGAGISGIAVARRLRQAGCRVHIIERNADIGGTWEENTYPGCGVDTPNHFYSFSFYPNPDWSRYFSKRDEIVDYLHHVYNSSELREFTTFQTEVIGAQWNDQTQQWTVEAKDTFGNTLIRKAHVLISASGHFNLPTIPKLNGLNTFDGLVTHTARWPRNVDLHGKRVAVIGTGASAMQVAPAIAPMVAKLEIFQRTPQWVRPTRNYNATVDPRAHRLFRDIPNYGKWYRFAQFWRYGDGLLRFLRRDPQWSHFEWSMNKVNDRHREEMTKYIMNELRQRPELIDKCIPDYPPFGKRILLDNDWFKTLARDNTTLVTDRIKEVIPSGIRTIDDVVHKVDAIVMATGFNVMSLAAQIDIRGIDGVRLQDDWANDNPTAYLGMMVPRFPNFFVMYGPNTNMGHGGSGIWLAETQSDFIVHACKLLSERSTGEICITESARVEYTNMVDAMHSDLVWRHPKVRSYYNNAAGAVRSPMPFRLVDYWRMTRTLDSAVLT